MIDRSKLPNSFEFVVTAGARARQLLAGSTPRVAVGEHKKTTVAQQEVASTEGRSEEDRNGRNRIDQSEVTNCHALIALGVTGGIGAYKAVEVARGLQKRGHEVVAVMTHSATRFVGADHVRGDHAPPGHHRSVRARRERRHRAHRARLDDRSAADRAGHRQHHRQARQRHRRRFSVDAVHRHARAGAARAGDEHADVRARGGAAQPRHAGGARRRASSSPARAIWRAGGLAKGVSPSPTRSSPRPRRSLLPDGPLRGTARAGHRRSDLRRRRSGALHRQPIERPDGICDRRRGGAARRAR